MNTSKFQKVESLAMKLDPLEREELLRRLNALPVEANGSRPSLRDHRPKSVGQVLLPLGPGDDLLDEMRAA